MQLWKENLAQTNKKAAESLADPKQYENLFPQMKDTLVAEQYLDATEQTRPADHYLQVPVTMMASFLHSFFLQYCLTST